MDELLRIKPQCCWDTYTIREEMMVISPCTLRKEGIRNTKS